MNRVLEEYLKTIKQPSEKMNEVSILNEELRSQIRNRNFEKVNEINHRIRVVLNNTLKIK